MKITIIVSIIVAGLCWAASANQITYTLSGTGSGTLGADQFSDASFLITSIADTSGISETDGVFSVRDSIATVFVSGLGTATFNDQTLNADNTALSATGISTYGAILWLNSPTFANYDLGSSLDPVAGTPFGNFGMGFSTTAGNFTLSSVSSLTFQAEMTPEPSILWIFSMGLVVLLLRLRNYNHTA
jgi:hypothetical protein